jgi:hypothetical protein
VEGGGFASDTSVVLDLFFCGFELSGAGSSLPAPRDINRKSIDWQHRLIIGH